MNNKTKKIPYGQLTSYSKAIAIDLIVTSIILFFLTSMLSLANPIFSLLFLIYIYLIRKIVIAFKASHVFLNTDFFIIDKTIYIPLEDVSDIKYLGPFGRTSYGFKVITNRNYSDKKNNSFIFMYPSRTIIFKYGGQNNFRKAIMQAVNYKKNSLVNQSNKNPTM